MLSRIMKTPISSNGLLPSGSASLPVPINARPHNSMCASGSPTPVGSFGEDAMFELSTSPAVTDVILPAPCSPLADTPAEEMFEAELQDTQFEEADSPLSAAGPFAGIQRVEPVVSVKHQFALLEWDASTTPPPEISSVLDDNQACLSEGVDSSRQADDMAARQDTPFLAFARSLPMAAAHGQEVSPTSYATSHVGSFRGEPVSASEAVPILGSSPTRSKTAGTAGFIPPHQLIAASFAEEFAHSQRNLSATRYKSIAERLKSVVFEQTGFTPMCTAKGFLE